MVNILKFDDKPEERTATDQDADDPSAEIMTASYSEISFHDHIAAGPSSSAMEASNLNSEKNPAQRPASLSYNRRKGNTNFTPFP